MTQVSKTEQIFWATFLAKAGLPLLILALMPVESFLRKLWRFYIAPAVNPLMDRFWEAMYRAYWRRKGFTVESMPERQSEAAQARR